MEIVISHEARQVPSWLIFDVRQKMKRGALLLFCWTVAAVGAAGAQAFGPYESVSSPSGQYLAIAGIARAEVSPSARMRLRVLVTDVVSLRVEQVLTWLKEPWCVVWASERTILACGRREETATPEAFAVLAFEVDKDGRVVERPPSDAEMAQARAAFDAKKKGPNKAPEPTPGPVTPRATEGTSK